MILNYEPWSSKFIPDSQPSEQTNIKKLFEEGIIKIDIDSQVFKPTIKAYEESAASAEVLSGLN